MIGVIIVIYMKCYGNSEWQVMNDMGFRLGHSFTINLLSAYYLGAGDTVASKIDITVCTLVELTL